MPVEKSSMSTEVQHDKPAQTANTSINNQDTKENDIVATNDNHDKSSSPNAQVAQETLQTTTLDANKNDNTSAPKLEATTNEPAKASTTPLTDPSSHSPASRASPRSENNTSSLDAQTTTIPETSTTPIPDSSANKQSTSIPANDHMNSLPTAEHSTFKISDSDSNKQATPDLSKRSSTTGSTSNQNSNLDNQTNPQVANIDTNPATNQSTHTSQQPNNESSTSQIPDSDANKQSNAVATNDSSKSSTTMDPTSNQDSSVVDQTNPLTTDNDDKQATNQSTKTASVDPQTSKDNQGNPLLTDEPSTSQIPDTNANKQAKSVATDDSSNNSKTMVTTSSQDPNSADQTNPSKTDGDTKQATKQSTETDSKDPETDKKNSSSEKDPQLDQLKNLIRQELVTVTRNYPKLEEHGKKIKDKAEKVSEQYKKLTAETYGRKELRTLMKTVTKLKLEIPPRYMTYDDDEKQKKQKFGVESSEDISTMLQIKMPRLHDELFNKSPVCNTIHLRFNKLQPELQLCLLCFTVFPENAIISRRSMIYWWIGEGLIPGEDDIVEENANKIFKQLMDMNFIEPETKRSRSYVANCKMNPLIRAALVMIADKVKFFDFDKYGNPKDFGKFDEIESPEDMAVIYPLGEPTEFFVFYDEKGENISKPEFTDSCQFAARPPSDQEPVNRNGDRIDKNKKFYLYERRKLTTKSYKACLMGSGLSKGIPWENLHMMFNVKDVILEFKPEWFLRMKNINVLFLGKWQSSVTHHIEVEELEFLESLEYMNNVRFFSLNGVSRISKLPDSISKLKNLLILDLRACHNLEEIPVTIGLLKCLTHLDMSECYLLRKIPKEISSLESLQVLKGFVIVELPDRYMCTLNDLRQLEHLRKLSMYTHMKNFPQETHLEALENIFTLRKLTILWGGHESTPETNKEKQDVVDDNKHNLASRIKNFMPKKPKRVHGNMRRMNAFSNPTLGTRLEKLDLKCFPHSKTPEWLTPGKLQGLKKLYIRGGHFSDLGQNQDTLEWDDSPTLPKETWKVETLRLKYLEELKMEWRELQNLFPKLTYLEKVKCPRLTLFPCNEQGVWKKGSSTT